MPQLTLAMAQAIDRVSKQVPKPDTCSNAEQHTIARAFWDVIQILQDSGVPLTVDEWEGGE